MKHLLALAALAVSLTACSYSASLDKEPPAPTIVYVRDEKAISEAKTDGEIRGIMAAVLLTLAVVVFAGVYQGIRTARDEPVTHRPAQLPPAVVTHNHNHYHDNRTVIVQSPPNSEGRQRARALIDGDRQTGQSRGAR